MMSQLVAHRTNLIIYSELSKIVTRAWMVYKHKDINRANIKMRKQDQRRDGNCGRDSHLCPQHVCFSFCSSSALPFVDRLSSPPGLACQPAEVAKTRKIRIDRHRHIYAAVSNQMAAGKNWLWHNYTMCKRLLLVRVLLWRYLTHLFKGKMRPDGLSLLHIQSDIPNGRGKGCHPKKVIRLKWRIQGSYHGCNSWIQTDFSLSIISWPSTSTFSGIKLQRGACIVTPTSEESQADLVQFRGHQTHRQNL